MAEVMEPVRRAAMLALAASLLADGRHIVATIDVSQQVAEMERALRLQDDPRRSCEVLDILERWQWDAMLDAPSRAHARQLVREFGLSIR